MKVAIAIDSFKGSLTSLDAGEAAREGVLRACPDATVFVRPLADGGEGTTDALVSAMGGNKRRVAVSDPLGRMVEAEYGIVSEKKLAVIEMSAAAGITLVSPSERDPMVTTTYGVGEMIADALALGCRRFLIGIGGSATNDGGVGMLQALGFDFLDREGKPIERGAVGLASLREIRTERAIAALSESEFLVACDVTNPLCGAQGCSAVFGPQKGAKPEEIETMDRWLGHYAALTKAIFPHADADAAGAGAAGGMGFALLSYLHAKAESGAVLVIRETELCRYLEQADLVITGEGALDGQSAMGKAPVGVARLAKRYGAVVIALAGTVKQDAALCHAQGIDAFFSILRKPCSLEEAMDKEVARENLSVAAEEATRLMLATKKR